MQLLQLTNHQQQKMEKFSSNMLLLLTSLLHLLLLLRPASSATILVDGVSDWKNPSVFVGDSVIFKHKYLYNLYIFKNQEAFNLCNFTQAIPLTNPNSTTYTWHPSRPGFFYFTFKNGSSNSCNLQFSQKLAVKVISPPPPTSPAPQLPSPPVPAPSSGESVPSSPAYPWPQGPREAAFSPAPAPSSVTVTVPGKGGGMPFINSNPAVPLPTGEIDSATIRPLPTSPSSSTHHQRVSLRILVGIEVTFLLSAVLTLL